MPRETRMAALVSFIRWILIIASPWMGRARPNGYRGSRPRSRPKRGIFRSDRVASTTMRARARSIRTEAMMRFYDQPHQFYCGVDLHARSMYLCIRNHDGAVVLHQNFVADAKTFLEAVAPFRDGLVVGCECMFAWYWVADLCAAHNIPFVLGHALYLKAIHGGKTKNDKLDADKLSALLRGGNFPVAYVYPQGLRETRDLLRRRNGFVRQRALLVAHIQNTNS